MGTSRDDDLRELHRIMNDPDKPKHVRRTAHRSFENILKQSKDKKLEDLRWKLIQATRANDKKWIESYERQIEEYSWRMGYAKPVTE